ncbi:MAG: hypothetical protein [Bacteriophage sp.]|nr:MAG: hypothetical protein [Bacteriophage sp.]
MNYKEIKSYEDACKVLGVQPISENAVAAFPAEDRKSMLAYHKLTIIARAINGGWKPDWNNRSQYKYYPVFYYEIAGLSFALLTASNTIANVGSRLCFQTEAMSDYAAATFADLYTDFYCLPASVEKEESQQSNKQPGDFLKMATDIIETQLQPLAQEKKTRGVVLIACDTDTTDEKGESATGAIIGIVGNGKALAHGVAELMTRKESAPLVKQATELIAMQRLQERIKQEGAKFLAELFTQQEK